MVRTKEARWYPAKVSKLQPEKGLVLIELSNGKAEWVSGDDPGITWLGRRKEWSNYTNHCWACQNSIDGNIDLRCPTCGYFICNRCGACDCKSITTAIF